jgi:FKBP-type peptidyl-prolyl cis-trans isomerase SlyD
MGSKVENGKVVSFSYTLKDKSGNVIEKSKEGEPLLYMHGQNNIIPGLEKGLEGLKVGDTKNVKVGAAEAYGEYDKNLVFKVPRENFPKDVELKEGMQFQTDSENGTLVITIKEINGNEVLVDGNHPMAGEELHFDVQIDDVRDATEQENQHGHAHSHGHDH